MDGVLDPATCAALKSHVFALRDSAADPTTQRWNIWMGAADNRYVPGSRVRFANALEEQLTAERSDVMLPLEDALVADALRTAASSLRRTLWEGSAVLPTSFKGSGCDEGRSDGEADGGDRAQCAVGESESLKSIEIVECGALIALPGADHQALHAE